MQKVHRALITGASRGIGRAIADRLASEGIDLVLICKRNGALQEELAKDCENRYGIACSTYVGDVADPEFVRAVYEAEDDLDLVINNAGISEVGLITDLSDEAYRRLMGVNLDGVFYSCREAARQMVRRHEGRIINITSVWGEVGASMEVAYSASKAGVIGLTKALAKELAPSGIAVNAISCGLIDTDMNRHLSSEELEELLEEIPAGKEGTPQEVARLTALLAEAPVYLTGQVVRLDGGWI